MRRQSSCSGTGPTWRRRCVAWRPWGSGRRLGLSNDEIARRLYLSINSVKTYIRSAYRKIGVTRRTQAAMWWVEHGAFGQA